MPALISCCSRGGASPAAAELCTGCLLLSGWLRSQVQHLLHSRCPKENENSLFTGRDGVPTRPHCPRTAGGVGDQKGGSVKPPAPANLAAEQSWGQTIWWCKTGGSAYPAGVRSVLDTQGPSLLQTFWGSQLRMCWVKSAGAGHLRCSKFLLAARPGSLLRMRGCGWWHDEGHPGNSRSCLYLVLATLLCSI